MGDVAVMPLAYGVRRLLVKPYVKNLAFNVVNMLPHDKTIISR